MKTEREGEGRMTALSVFFLPVEKVRWKIASIGKAKGA